jgi:hypothetical protein
MFGIPQIPASFHVDFKRPFTVVPFQENIFGGTDTAVERQHLERVCRGKLGLFGKYRGERMNTYSKFSSNINSNGHNTEKRTGGSNAGDKIR